MLKGAGEGNAALLAAGQLLRKSVPSASHAETGKKFLGAVIGFMGIVAREDSRQGGVIQGSKSGKQGVGLQEKTDPAGADFRQLRAGKGK